MELPADDYRTLLAIIGSGLHLAGRSVLVAAADRATGTSEPARKLIRESIARELLVHFEVSRKPDAIPPATGRLFRPGDPPA